MKSLRAEKGGGATVSWTNEDGDRVAVPFLRLGKEWKPVGVYLKYGTSKSDPKFAAIFPLPHNWEPSTRIKRLLRRNNG